jgi:cytochrome c oxidase assembly protein subunit 15
VHFVISMALVAASTVLVVRDREGDGRPTWQVGGRVRGIVRPLDPLLLVVLVLGVVTTGSGPHSGDEEVAYRFALDPVAASQVHAAAVWVYVLVVAAFLVTVLRTATPSRVRTAAIGLAVVTVAQGAVGYAQYFSGLPAALVATHMLGASLLVIAQVLVRLSLRTRPATV